VIGREADPVLRRLERDAARVCFAAAVIALVIGRGNPNLALGTLGGGALVGLSYWSIKSSVDAIAQRGPAEAGRRVWTLVKLTGRYALLGFLAYVMIARLRLHPIGLLTGASSVVAAAALEAARTLNIRRFR
jgi:hypothetical protein